MSQGAGALAVTVRSFRFKGLDDTATVKAGHAVDHEKHDLFVT